MNKVIFSFQTIILLTLSLIGIQANCQQHKTVDLKDVPSWVTMIDNPTANYYEAEKVYADYWKNHAKPNNENDVFGEKQSKAMSPTEKQEERAQEREKKRLKKMSDAEHNDYVQLAYQCKRFENWMREMKPFVQEDGRILTEQERMAIWNKQQEEIKQQNKLGK